MGGQQTGPTSSYRELEREVEALKAEREAYKGEVGRLRENIHELRAQITELRKERDAYKKAKQENDERFMNERDAALAEVERLKATRPPPELSRGVRRVVAGPFPLVTEPIPWPTVGHLADEMRRKLDSHIDDRGREEGWRSDSPAELLRRLDEEVAELRRAVRLGQDVWSEAADVANFAMMVADVTATESK